MLSHEFERVLCPHYFNVWTKIALWAPNVKCLKGTFVVLSQNQGQFGLLCRPAWARCPHLPFWVSFSWCRSERTDQTDRRQSGNGDCVIQEEKTFFSFSFYFYLFLFKPPLCLFLFPFSQEKNKKERKMTSWVLAP